jgi:hypothetical protein
MEVLRSIA